MAAVLCRLCSTETERTHSVSLFSKDSVQKDLPGRLSRLAQVPVGEEDGLSGYLCRKCKGKFVSLEAKLDAFRAMAKAVASPRQRIPACRKRVKDTSGGLVSPHTAHARPRSKRSTSSRVLFPDKENTTANSSKSYAQ